MQNNKINQENEESKFFIRRFMDWIDQREQKAGRPPISFMLYLLLLEFVGFGLYIMLVMCSWQTILIISASTFVGLIVLWALEKLVRKIFFRKKSRLTKLQTSGNNQNSKESLIDKSEDKNKIEDLNLSNGVKTEYTNNINNVIKPDKLDGL